MFFNSLKRKLKKSYSVLNKEIEPLVFPGGEQEYIYVGTALNALFKKQDIFKLIQIYVSVYTYYNLVMGNIARTFTYTKKKAAGALTDGESKTLIALIMLNITENKSEISDPVAKVHEFKRHINSFLSIVEGIKKNQWRFKTEPIAAGTVNSPILVDGVCGIHEYIDTLKIPGVEKIDVNRTSTLYLTDEICNISYAIDEYTLTNATDGSKIASLWFNIYGTENTDVQPVCFSDKTPFSVAKIAPELFLTGEKEWKTIEDICQNAQVPYDRKKLVISTFVYFHVIWIFGFKGIRAGQAMDLRDAYIDRFVEYGQETFGDFPDKQPLTDILKRVDERIRGPYQANDYTLVDDGFTDEFIFEFVPDMESASRIKPQIASRMMIDWVNLGQQADQTYLT